MAVLVIDKRKRPLMRCSEKGARLLLERGRAVVVKRYPFTTWLRDRVDGQTQPVRIKLDPGCKTTGIAAVTEEGSKTHVLDAACVGTVEALVGWQIPALMIKATGRASYCRTRLDKYDFPHGYCMRTEGVGGFKTGDVVRAVVPRDKNAGTHIGRVAVGARGSFNIGSLRDISAKYCTLISRGDGYGYKQEVVASSVGSRRHSPPR